MAQQSLNEKTTQRCDDIQENRKDFEIQVSEIEFSKESTITNTANKSVFNLSESKVCLTPSPLMTQSPKTLNDDIESYISSFENTDSKDSTGREVQTEDKDTTEGPFSDANDFTKALVSPKLFMTTLPLPLPKSPTFTSPAISGIDKSLALSGNTLLLDKDASMQQPTRECNNADIALTQLRELFTENEIHIYTKKLKEILSGKESQVRTLEKEREERLKRINNLIDCLTEETKKHQSMVLEVEKHERMKVSLIADMDQERKKYAEEKVKLINEIDELTDYLNDMEVSFITLQSKYEKNKVIISSMQAKQKQYKKTISELQVKFVEMSNKCEFFKQLAPPTLTNYANEELKKINKSQKAEILKLNNVIKSMEFHISFLEKSIGQLITLNKGFVAIYNEHFNMNTPMPPK